MTTLTKLPMAKIETPSVAHLPELTHVLATPQHGRHMEMMRVLHHLLTVKRPHGSIEEARQVTWLSKRYPCTLIDGAGNLHFDCRTSSEHKTMFTAHTDTVHHKGGANLVRVDGKFWRADGDVLGADDGAGVALLAHLMSHGVPGYYILFRGEECGGVGSSWLADNMPELLGEFDRAVAFDRAGYYDVITHQGGARCCSEAFANELAHQLSQTELLFAPCDGGVYTDTAEFVGIIPECTNISVGYKAQHSSREEQDVEFLMQLADELVKVEWDKLPTERNPKVKESKWGRSFDDRRYTSKSYWHDQPGHVTPMADWQDFKEWASVPDPYAGYDAYADMDEPEADLMYALEEAFDNLNTRYLLAIVAEYMNPEDPDSVRMDAYKLNAQNIKDAMDMLTQGFDAYTVAEEIHSQIYIN